MTGSQAHLWCLQSKKCHKFAHSKTKYFWQFFESLILFLLVECSCVALRWWRKLFRTKIVTSVSFWEIVNRTCINVMEFITWKSHQEVTTSIPVPYTHSNRCIILGNKARKREQIFMQQPVVASELLREPKATSLWPGQCPKYLWSLFHSYVW